MATGKSTLGRVLAKSLQWDFIDMDDLIEEKEKMSIADIFEQKGEDYFRKLEKAILRDFEPDSKLVIATGGGTPCFNDNISEMLDNGIVVYLQASYLKVLSRLIGEKTHRPLVKDKSSVELRRFVKQQLTIRRPYYEQADITIRNSGRVEHVVKRLVKRLRR